MRMWQQLDMISLLDTLASLLLAFVLGSLVGLERQYRQRTAGLRTNVLVAVGAALASMTCTVATTTWSMWWLISSPASVFSAPVSSCASRAISAASTRQLPCGA